MNKCWGMDRGWRSIKMVIALGVLAMLVLPALASAQDDRNVSPAADYSPHVWHTPQSSLRECEDLTVWTEVAAVSGSSLTSVQIGWRINMGLSATWVDMIPAGTTGPHGGAMFYYTIPASNYSLGDDVRYRIVAVSIHWDWIFPSWYSTHLPDELSRFSVPVNQTCDGTVNLNVVVNGWDGNPGTLPSPMHWSFTGRSGSTSSSQGWPGMSVPAGTYNLTVDPAPSYWTRSVSCGSSFTVTSGQPTNITITYTQQSVSVRLSMLRDSNHIATGLDPQTEAKWHITAGPSGYPTGNYSHNQTVTVPSGSGYAFSWDAVTGWTNAPTTQSGVSINGGTTYTAASTYTRIFGNFTGNMDRNAADIGSADDPQTVATWSFSGYSATGNHGETKSVPVGTYNVTWSAVTGWTQTYGTRSVTVTSSGVTSSDTYTRTKGTLNINIVVNGFGGGALPSEKGWSFLTYSDSTMTGSNWSQSVGTGNYDLTVDASPAYWNTVDVKFAGPASPPVPSPNSFSVDQGKTTTITITYTQQTGHVQLTMERNAADIQGGDDPQLVAKWHITTGPSGHPTGNYSHNQSVEVPAGQGYAFSWDAVSGWNNSPDTETGVTVNGGATHTAASTYTRIMGNFTGRMDRDAGDIYTADDPRTVATWSIDERSDLGSHGHGDSVSLPIGDYHATWTAVSGWSQTYVKIAFTITEDSTTEKSELYARHKGSATLYVNPEGYPRDNATWKISERSDLGTFTHGQTASGLPTGDYTFVWSTLSCYNQSVGSTTGTVTNGGNFTATETYTRQKTELQINMTYDVPFQGGETAGSASVLEGSNIIHSGLVDGSVVWIDKGVNYTVVYSSIPYYNTPAPANVYVECDQQGERVIAPAGVNPEVFVTREYFRKTGKLTVILQKDGAAPGPAGAQYTVDGYGGGYPVTGTSAAPMNIYQGMAYSVAFNTIANYDTPPTPVAVNLPDGVDGVPSETVYGNYLIHRGSLVGFANVPDGTGAPAGSKWRIIGLTGWMGIGNKVFDLPLGTYKVEYDFVTDYVTPYIRTVTISSKGELADTVGIYIPVDQIGSLQVFIEPEDEVIPDGAQWRPVITVKGASPVAYPWKKSGVVVPDLPIGGIGIEFDVAPGWILPELTGATIKRDELTKATGEYIRPLIVHAADYNGDGLDDLGSYDSRTGKWTVVTSGATSPTAKTTTLVDAKFGKKDDIAAPGDYDGDGIADLAYFREKTGEYRIKQATGSLKIAKFGEKRDIPVPGDYDGDGKTDAALYRPSTGEWIFHRIFEDLAANDDVTTFTFGWNGTIPVPGDYNADGMTDLAVYDVKARTWHVAIWKQKKGTWVNVKTMQTPYGKLKFPLQHGEIGNIPIQADYDGDGSTDIAIFRRGDVNFNVLNQYEIQVGKPGDMPVPNDWAGLGRVIPAVFRATAGRWIAVDNLLGTTLLNAKHGANSTPLMSGR